MTLCTNHHCQFHYGLVSVKIEETMFAVGIDDATFAILKGAIPNSAPGEADAA
jgi:hypothetical protein